ncbi:MAG TPA: biotin/lipoyl-containing protein, partial [Pseudomonas sp.]
MSELIRVPDIGSGDGEVIELLVKVGDRIEADQSLLTLESDKASMEIPAPKAGVIKSLKIKLGDKLKTGDELLELEAEGAAASAPAAEAPAAAPAAPVGESLQPVHVPDIGSAGKARIIELLVKAGDVVSAEQSLLVLESDKASMEIPCPQAGTVDSVAVKLNDEVGTGELILTLRVAGAVPAAAPVAAAPAAAPAAPA